MSIQPEYNIASPTRANFERELARVCEIYGVGVILYSPLAGSFQAGKYSRDGAQVESTRASEIAKKLFSEQNWAILDHLREVTAAHSVLVAQVSLAWLLSKPYLTAPIVGANSAEQLGDLMPVATLELTPERLAALDEVSRVGALLD